MIYVVTLVAFWCVPAGSRGVPVVIDVPAASLSVGFWVGPVVFQVFSRQAVNEILVGSVARREEHQKDTCHSEPEETGALLGN